MRPVVHYMMGGVHTDVNAATAIPGLYAAGEVACVSINGANRLGSNSLTETLVFGARAGKGAAQYALENSEIDNAALSAQIRDEEQRIKNQFFRKSGGTERIATLRAEMHNSMEGGCGIYRDDATLRETCDTLAELRDRFADIYLDDNSKSFNTELTAALELEFMLDLGEVVAHSALARTESRGSHQRTDFPERDDENWMKHTIAWIDEDYNVKIDYRPVHMETLTNEIQPVPPKARVY